MCVAVSFCRGMHACEAVCRGECMAVWEGVFAGGVCVSVHVCACI